MLSLLNPFDWARLLFAVWPWYANVLILWVAVWPIMFRVCSRVPDRGYAAARAMGVILMTYLAWLMANSGGATFTRGVRLATLMLATIGGISLVLQLREIARFLRLNLRLVLVIETLFLVTFCAMLALRAAVPHITYVIQDQAAEKFTDFAILNSLLTSDYFPPHDAWVSGFNLNYYYFGHLLWAALIKLSRVRPEIGFNLALATVCALTAILSFSLGYNFTRRLRWGFLACFLITFSSNVDGFLQLIEIARAAIFDHPVTKPWYSAYNYWRSSRAVENTINEFPAFSFILGDLHAHLSTLVIFLTGLVLVLQIWRSVRHSRSLLRYELTHLDELFLAALLCGAMFAGNSWDAISFGGLIALAFWLGRKSQRSTPALSFGHALEAALLAGVVVIVGVLVLFRSFTTHFSSPFPTHVDLLRNWPFVGVTDWPISGVSIVNRTDPFEFFGHWVMLLAAPVALTAVIMASAWRRLPQVPETGEKKWAIVSALLAVATVGVTFTAGWVASLTTIAAIVLATALFARRWPPRLQLLLGLLLFFSVVTWFCELFFFDDIFSGTIERINTVFKLYYGLWPLAALACILATRQLIRYAPPRARGRRAFWLVAPLVLLGLPYPIIGTMQRIEATTPIPPADSTYNRLDGMRYLHYLHPDDYQAILWLRSNTKPDARILEAPGRQYEYNGRIATNTGRPAFGGWLYHEWGWRGDRWGSVERDRRLETAETFYSGRDPRRALRFLLAERIEYFVVGELERQAYPWLDESRFEKFAETVFRSGETAVYRVRPDVQPEDLPEAPPEPPEPPQIPPRTVNIPDVLTSATRWFSQPEAPDARHLLPTMAPEFDDSPATTSEVLPIDDLTTTSVLPLE